MNPITHHHPSNQADNDNSSIAVKNKDAMNIITHKYVLPSQSYGEFKDVLLTVFIGIQNLNRASRANNSDNYTQFPYIVSKAHTMKML